MPRDVNWDVYEIDLKYHNIPQLPDSPVCPILVKLFLQGPGFTVIPPTFFEHMPLLEVLDLSNTSILSLPTSISSLNLLQEFFLRDCSALMELPTQIGMLIRLKLFDINGTELMSIPKEMGKLKDLEVLRISLSQYAKEFIKTKIVNETVIPKKMISELKKLKELWISVSPEAEWWEEEVKDIQNELCDLENLQTLRWYLPTNEVLHQFLLLERNHSPIYANLSNFVLTVGQHAQLTSCLPRDLEKKFEELKKCLKWINAEENMDDIHNIMESTEALFLSRHWTIEKLSKFNISKLKYCLLAECDEMETLVEAEETRIKNCEKVGFELLQYLSIHHMNKLQSIWKGPIGKDSLSKVTILALHTCTQLSSIFTLTIAQNLQCLTELTVEDCPKVRSLISNESNSVNCGPIFPSLERMFLVDLPELVKIFGGLVMLEKLRNLLIYNCLQLRLSIMELPHIKKIEGENEWWNDLDCDKSQWENIFVPLKKKRELVEQLFQATNSLQHFHAILSREHDEKKSSDLNDVREQVMADTSMEKGKGKFIPPEESKDNESYRLSHSEAPDTETETDIFYSFGEVDHFSLSGQETEDDESYGSCHSESDDFYSFEEVERLSLSEQENDMRQSFNLSDMGEQVYTADTGKGKGISLPPEGDGMLGVTKPKWQDRLKSKWKAISDAMPQLTIHPWKSNKFETNSQDLKSYNPDVQSFHNDIERMTKLVVLEQSVDAFIENKVEDMSKKPHSILSQSSGSERVREEVEEKEVDQKANDFIEKFKTQLKLQRLDSVIQRQSLESSERIGPGMSKNKRVLKKIIYN